MSLADPLFTHCLLFLLPIRKCLCEISNSQRGRGATEEFGGPPGDLRRCCKQDFVPDSAQAP